VEFSREAFALKTPSGGFGRYGDCSVTVRLGLLRVMQLSAQGFHNQTDKGVGNGVRR
jgi:hypothetical protein